MAGVMANVAHSSPASVFFSVTRDSWRWVMLVGAAPAALALFITFFVPESERWKQAVRKGPSQPVREIFSPPLLKNTLLAIAFASVALIVTWGIVQWIPLWADQMTQGRQPRVKAWIQLASAFGAIVGCLIAPLIGGRFGRRPVYFGLCLSSLLACSFLFRGFATYNGAFLVMIGVVGMCTAAFYGWMPQYLPELFPTRVRATGQGLAYNFGRILAALGAWQMGALMGFFDKSYAKAVRPSCWSILSAWCSSGSRRRRRTSRCRSKAAVRCAECPGSDFPPGKSLRPLRAATRCHGNGLAVSPSVRTSAPPVQRLCRTARL
jgi:MFS family permease